MAATESEGIRSLQTHLEDMRSLTLCKICLKPFYEPYILACGHTYCYSCLRSWFSGSTNGDRQKNKNCPDCRTLVKVAPAPNYLLRDLAHLFVGRTELLPEDETADEHAKDKVEEAMLLARDRSGPGLFQGVFNTYAPPWLSRPIAGPIHDYEDGVARCPNCAWELEEGDCIRCGYNMDDDAALALSDLDNDDLSDDSDMSADMAVQQLVRDTRAHTRASGPGFFAPEADSDDTEDDSDFDDEDDNQYDLHDDFVDNDEELDLEAGSAVGGDYDNYPTDAATPYSHSDSASDANSETNDNMPRPRPRRRTIWSSDEEADVASESGSELARVVSGDMPRPPSVSRASIRRRPIVIEEEEEDEDEEVDVAFDPSSNPTSQAESNLAEPASSDAQEEDEEQGEAGTQGTRGFDSAHSATASDSGLSDTGDSDDSEDTVIPPQPVRSRRQRLQDHRARRPKPSSRVTIDLVTPPSRSHNHGQGSNAAASGRRSRTTRVY